MTRLQRGLLSTIGLPRAGLAIALGCACAASCANHPSSIEAATEVVARPPLQRLTRDQYDHTVRDLLGIDGDPAATFAEDEAQAGYAANMLLPIQELQLEQYEQAAETLASQAVATKYAALVPCDPQSGEAACVDQFLRTFGRRAFRRPMTDDEVATYAILFRTARMTATFQSGVQIVITAMLQSPHFLYRIEWGAPGASPESDGAIPLSSYEIASRLSYVLWDTMPDDALLATADAGELSTADQVVSTARAMLADPKARDGLAAFHQQWLQLQGLSTLEKTDPSFTADLRAAMQDEIAAYVDAVVRQGDGRLETLLTGDFTFARGPLYSLYALAPPPGDTGRDLARVSLPGYRAGVLTLSSVLAVHAHASQTSIVHRGKLVREQLLCMLIPPPPASVDTSLPPAGAAVSVRQFFAEHRASPACAGCHDAMDPLGDTFEEFDPIGRYRTKDDDGFPLDTTSTLSGIAGKDGPLTNAADLAQKLATADEVRQCFARQWFRFLFGRVEEDDDAATIAHALGSFQSSGYRIPDLIAAYTATRNFRYRTALSTQ